MGPVNNRMFSPPSLLPPHKTYKKQKASLKKDHQSGSTALKNGHAKADQAAALNKRRVD